MIESPIQVDAANQEWDEIKNSNDEKTISNWAKKYAPDLLKIQAEHKRMKNGLELIAGAIPIWLSAPKAPEEMKNSWRVILNWVERALGK